MKIIDFESHFFTREYIEYMRTRKEMPREAVEEKNTRMWYTDTLSVHRSFELEDRLLDLGEGRLKAMDAAGVDIQVLSLSGPNVQFFEAAEGVTWSRKT